MYTDSPIKSQDRGIWLGAKGAGVYEFSIDFPMVKWIDKQPWEISDLKN